MSKARLENFLALCSKEDNEESVTEYIKAGGNVLEILKSLDATDKKNITNVYTIFKAMHCVIIKILSSFPQKQASAEEACQYLINSHLSSIHSMLSIESTAKHRKLILKLLAAVVSLGGTFPRELLNHLSLHQKLVFTLTLHTNPSDRQSVRTCFIHFLLAFLVEGNAQDIRALLEKHGVFSSIFADLLYDYPEVIQLVLTTTRQYILENPKITKTTKLHVFSTPVIQSIVNLYNWKGPNNWTSFKKKETVEKQVDPAQKEVVVDAVHEFLTILLTSNKHGIVFNDKKLGTDSSQKSNELVHSILKSLEKPWEHKKPSELVILVLKACPDLIKWQLNNTEPYVVPRMSKNWFYVMDFIEKIISNMNEESCLKICSSEMMTNNLVDAILNLITPKNIIKSAIIPSLEHSNHLIRHKAISVLSAMAHKVLCFNRAFEKSFPNFEKDNVLGHIMDHTFKNMPNFEIILDVWKKAFSYQEEEERTDENSVDFSFNLQDHLKLILNLLQDYSIICPEILTSSNIENMTNHPTILLTHLSNLQSISEEELNFIKAKALKILLISNLHGFSPNEEIFSFALSFLLSNYETKLNGKKDDNTVDIEIYQTINLLLSNCGVFEGFNDETETWIEAFNFFDNYDQKLEIASWFIKIIKRVHKHTEKYISLIHKTEKNTEEEIMDLNRQEDIFNELSEKTSKEVKFVASLMPVASISLPTYAAIENLQKNSSDTVKNYMSIVLTHIMHFQVSTKTLVLLVENLEIPAKNFLLKWNSKNVSNILKKPFKHHELLVDEKFITIEKCEEDAHPVKVVNDTLLIKQGDSLLRIKLNRFYIKALVRKITFLITQFSQRNLLDEQNIVLYKDTLLSLLNAAHELYPDIIQECAKLILRHPIFLQYFQVVQCEEETTECIMTELLIQVGTLYLNFNLQNYISQFLQPYQEKFVSQIKSSVKKNTDKTINEQNKIYEDLIPLLQLSVMKIRDMLLIIMNLSEERFVLQKKSLSIWGTLVAHLILQYSKEKLNNETNLMNMLPVNLLKKIINYLISLKISYKLKMDLWENSILEYLQQFPRSILIVDEKILTDLVKTKLTPATIKLLTLILKGNTKLLAVFKNYVNINEDILQEKSFIFSVLSSNLNYKWDNEFLDKLTKFYQQEIIDFTTEVKTDEFTWLKENINAIAYLIEKSFDPNICRESCDVIFRSGGKLELAQEEHIKLFINFFHKSKEVNEDALKDLVQILIHITVFALKKDAKNIFKLNFLSEKLMDVIKNLKSEKDFTFEGISENNSWRQFIRISLKSGLKITKKAEKNNHSLLIRALAETCDIAYKNNGTDEYVKTIFEMTMSHTEFMNIILSNAEVKDDVLKLLFTLVKKNHSIMLSTQVPLYLAAYNASLTCSDQYILKILELYESSGIRLDGYRPYLWGNAAAVHYSVKSKIDTALWRLPSTSQVLDLLVPEIVSNTIRNYPVNRSWNTDFTNKDGDSKEIYDPAFYLPVFVHLLSENNVVACHKVIHSGALALSIISCSSLDKQVRLAGFTVISRFYFHLEATSSKEKLLWINFIDALRNGINKIESPLENLRLNGFVATFLARASLVMTQPLNPLYTPLQKFLMAKPALDLNTVPEVLQLFHSSEIEYKSHRQWILEVIRDGLKTDSDMDIALRCVLFKMLLDFYNCSLADKSTKSLILQIIRAVTKLQKPCMILVNGYALTPWLNTVYENMCKEDIDSVTFLSNIVNNILKVFNETKLKKENYHYSFLENMRLSLNKQLQAVS